MGKTISVVIFLKYQPLTSMQLSHCLPLLQLGIGSSLRDILRLAFLFAARNYSMVPG